MGAHSRIFPIPAAFPKKSMGRLLPLSRHRFRSGVVLTTLQCSLNATARMVARSPGSVRPGGYLRPTRAFTPELSQERVTPFSGQVSLHSTFGFDTVTGLAPAGMLPLQAARFPALRAPAGFSPRVMGPIWLELLSVVVDIVVPGSYQKVRVLRTATSYSTASSQSPDAVGLGQGDAGPSSQPSFE